MQVMFNNEEFECRSMHITIGDNVYMLSEGIILHDLQPGKSEVALCIHTEKAMTVQPRASNAIVISEE